MRIRSLIAGGILKKAALSAAALGAAASVAGLGTWATFTSTAADSGQVATGSVTITLGASGGADNRLNVAASDVAPGDTIQRVVKLTNGGSLNLASVALTTSATTSSLLDTDTTSGLQMIVEKCSVAWTESGPPYTYTCGGSTSTVLASTPVIVANSTLSNLSSTTAGSADFLRVKLTLPSGAGNTLQSKTSVIQYSFTGTQRAATDK